MTRTDIIQGLINKYNFVSYVEIGVQNPENNFNKISCKFKSSVDPDPNAKADFVMTSDNFFVDELKFFSIRPDIFFIDGLHEDSQVERDIKNALFWLRPGGFIVCHDMNPPTELHQRVPRENKQWNGDCWKTFVKLRERSDLNMLTVDCDWGCGIIYKGHQIPLGREEELTYENFDKNRQRWLNLVSPEWFEKMYL